MKARGVVRISPADVGARVSVRARIPEPGDGPSMTDTVGILERWTDDGILCIRRRDGELVEIDAQLLVAARTFVAELRPRNIERG